MKIVVIGIGQSLRSDDGAGLAAVQLWKETFPTTAGRADVRVELEELPDLALLDLLKGTESAILVDAVRSGATPGSLHMLDESQLVAFSGFDSAHGWGVAETLRLGRRLDPQALPARIVLIGIEVGQVNLGESLSPEVTAALPKVVQAIQEQCTLLVG